MPKKKVLILYGSAGLGHKKAAMALVEALQPYSEGLEVIARDVLEFSNPFFRWNYSQGYLIMIRYFLPVWGLFFYLLDNPLIYRFILPLRHLVNLLNCRRLLTFIKNLKPDLIVTTHFLPNEMISSLRPKPYTISCVTDFKVHCFWITSGVDLYLVGSDGTRDDLVLKGVSRDKIRITGIPVSTRFYQQQDRQMLARKLNLRGDRFTVSVIGGGFGIGPIERIVQGLDKSAMNLQILVVCGKNKKLFRRLELLKNNFRQAVSIYGFVDNVDEIMGLSDVMIGKSGGLLMSEAMAKNLPVLVIAPVPGQETNNVEVLWMLGVAITVKNIREILGKIEELYNSPGALRALKKKIAAGTAPQPGIKIAELIYEKAAKPDKKIA